MHSSFVLQDASAQKTLVLMLLALEWWELHVRLILVTAVRHGLLMVKMSLTNAKVSFNTSKQRKKGEKQEDGKLQERSLLHPYTFVVLKNSFVAMNA